MRVFVDTNIFIAYLLSPRKDSLVKLLLDKVADGDVILLVSRELLEEINATVQRKPKLIKIVTKSRLSEFIRLLLAVSEEIPPYHRTNPTNYQRPQR